MSNASTGLTITIDANTANALMKMQGFFNGVNGSMQKMSGLAAVLSHELAALASVAGFVALAKSSLNLADTLGKVSQSVGSNVKELAGIAYAAEKDELALDSLKTGLRAFADYLVKTGRGATDLKQALLEQARIFAAMPDGATKATLAVDRFGRAGLSIIPFLNQGADAMEEMFERGGRLSGVNEAMSRSANEFNDALTDLKWASQGLAGTLGTMLLPQITKVILATTEGIVKFREWTKEADTFRIAIEAVAAGLAVFATYKGILGGTKLLSAFIGAGAITSVADFVAALRLLPAAAAGAAASLAPLALGVAAVTTALVTGIEFWKAYKETTEAIKGWDRIIEKNNELAESIRKVAKARYEAGDLSAQEFVDINDRTLLAQSAPAAQASEKLRALAASLKKPVGPEEKPKQWTKDELEMQIKSLDVEIARLEILRGKNELTYKQTSQILFLANQQKQLDDEESAIWEKRRLAQDAKEQMAISTLEYDQIDLAVQKEALAIANAKADIEESIRQKKIRDINADWRLTPGQKRDQITPLMTDEEKHALGFDARSWSESWQDAITTLTAGFESLAGTITGGFTSAVESAFNSMATLVGDIAIGQAKMAQGWLQIGQAAVRSIMMMVSQYIAGQFAMAAVETILHVKRMGQASAENAVNAAGGVAKAGQQGGIWGVLIYAAAYAAVMASVMALTAAATGGYAEGGYTGPGAKHEVAGVVHKGEVVFSQEDVGRVGLKPLMALQGGGSLMVPNKINGPILQGDRSTAIGEGSSPSITNVSPAPVYVAVLNDKSELTQFLKSHIGEQIIVQTVLKNRPELGFLT